jgi:hypothetical protein
VTSYLKSDIVYIGYAKDGRHAGLQRVFRTLTDKGLVVDMILVGVPEEERLYSNEIVYLDAPIPYVTILERTNNSKCILVYETLSVFKNTEMPVNTLGSEFGGSIRLREAVVYNKKFLTNSIECTFSRYYDPKFMYVFEDADSLNFDDVVRFIRDDNEPVDYHYGGDYAPQLWIQQIDSFLADGKE